jgi:hypothetical protein
VAETKPLDRMWQEFLTTLGAEGWTEREKGMTHDAFWTGAWAAVSLVRAFGRVADPDKSREAMGFLFAEADAWEKKFGAEKADENKPQGPHLKALRRTGHLCHWPGCTVEVPPKMWGCPKHWGMLPMHLRAAIWKHYRPGQEVDKKPSAFYVEAERAVQEWIKYQAGNKSLPPSGSEA